MKSIKDRYDAIRYIDHTDSVALAILVLADVLNDNLETVDKRLMNLERAIDEVPGCDWKHE